MKSLILLTSFALILGLWQPNTAYAQVQAGCWDSGGLGGYMGPVPANGICPPGQYIVNSEGNPGSSVSNSLTYVPLEPFPGQTSGQSNFCQLLDLIFKFLIYLGAMLAVLFLVLAGITYMISEVVDKRSAARDRIKAAVWGLIILLASWIILNTINPQLITACNVIGSTTTGVAPPAPPPSNDEKAAQLRAQCQANSPKSEIKTFPKADPKTFDPCGRAAALTPLQDILRKQYDCYPISNTESCVTLK